MIHEKNADIRKNIMRQQRMYPREQYLNKIISKKDNGRICSYLIASHKVSALILMDSKSLMNQWIGELKKFLVIHEAPPQYTTPKGRIKTRDSAIGTMAAGNNKMTGIIDVAMIDSLCRREDMAEILSHYGLVIMDECHHGASPSAQIVLDGVVAKYVYGVSATPIRGDRLERINYMLLGPIRATYSARERAADQGIDHLVRPRFTRVADTLDSGADINAKYMLLRNNASRNAHIVRDVRTCIENGRTVAVLTRYKEHARNLAEMLEGAADHVLLLYGDQSDQENAQVERQLPQIPDSESVVLIATGQKIGEGFNYPRLDTLILATPISMPGRVEQYVGRLNRDYPGKCNVIVYDYVDQHIPTFDNMYHKRLRTYRKIGYRVVTDAELTRLSMPYNGSVAESGIGIQGVDTLKP